MQDIDRKRLAISRGAVTAAALAMPLVPAKGRAASAEPVKIGWLPSLTGPLATAAIGFDHGVRFGVEQANKAGGIDGRPIELAADGSFWFTDCGRVHRYHEDRGAVYWARPDGSEIRLVASPLEKPNGIGLSPDGTTLFVAETTTARLWAYDILGPGVLRCLDRGAPFAVRRCVAGLPGYQLLDSLAVQANGDVCVATIPLGVTIFSPAGDVLSQLEMPDEIPTNICFGGADLKQAYVTLSSTGRLYAVPWKQAGLRLAFAR